MMDGMKANPGLQAEGQAVGRVDAEGRVTWYDPIPEGGALLYARPVPAAPAGEPAMPSVPNLSQELINTIGEYGMARTDGVSEAEVLHRWQLVLSGIKRYAHAYGDARAEHARRSALEAAATLCDAERAEFMEQAGKNNGRQSDMAFGSVNSAERIAAAIRENTP
jgi:hypothetical protein